MDENLVKVLDNLIEFDVEGRIRYKDVIIVDR